MKLNMNAMRLNWMVTALALALAVIAGGSPLFS